MNLEQILAAVAAGRHGDPFGVLGPHATETGFVVRCLQPHASRVYLLRSDAAPIEFSRTRADGMFELTLAQAPGRYRLRLLGDGWQAELDDPYRFASTLGELDAYLLGEGTHLDLAGTLGAVPMTVDDSTGVRFSVWAPNARRVSVVGAFNDWDGRRHPMRLHPGNGVWELFVPGLSVGALYKFELLGPDGALLPLKADPLAKRMEPPPGNASVVYSSEHVWGDQQWWQARTGRDPLTEPVSVYEVHAGSWRRRVEEDGRWLSYRELADELVPYVCEMGYTHIELLPMSEHPFDGSWGYQPIGLFAPTWRFGSPDDFKYLVDRCHQQGIGVILDWVPAHFPKDEYGLARFDGTCLYEHADPRQAEHADWGTLIYNFSRTEVVNFLFANALWWVREYHIDALRVDAVASMLYLDYSREPGEWVPNHLGGNENLEAVSFLKRLNAVVHQAGAFVIAEESTSWPMVSRPVWDGGLGFTFKWNMGWMHDTLGYMREDPVHRQYHHDRLTFGLLYAFSENFVLPLSHDEVVHGKGSIIARMPGDEWQQFANLRAYYAFMFAYPGKKLLFMGSEFGQRREWDHDTSLDWDLLEAPLHAGLHGLVRDLNGIYTSSPALYRQDCTPGGFGWIDCADREQSVFAFLRSADTDAAECVVVSHFTPVVRDGYRIGVPRGGWYQEVLNTDASDYGGSGRGNLGGVAAEAVPAHGFAWSVVLTLPPLATVYLQPVV